MFKPIFLGELSSVFTKIYTGEFRRLILNRLNFRSL